MEKRSISEQRASLGLGVGSGPPARRRPPLHGALAAARRAVRNARRAVRR